MEKKINIKGDYIKLDAALKCAGLVSTGGHAKIVIQNGEVKINGEVCTQRGRKLKSGDKAEYNENTVLIENVY